MQQQQLDIDGIELQHRQLPVNMRQNSKPSSISYLNQFVTPNQSKFYVPKQRKRQKCSPNIQNSKLEYQIPMLNLSYDQNSSKNYVKKPKTPQYFNKSNVTYKIREYPANGLSNSVLQEFATSIPIKELKHISLQDEFTVQDIFKKIDDRNLQNRTSQQQKKSFLQEENKNLKQYNHFLVEQVRTFSKKYKKYKEMCQAYRIAQENLKHDLTSTIKSYQLTAIQILEKLKQLSSHEQIKNEITTLLMPYVNDKNINNPRKKTQNLKTQSQKEQNLLNSVGSPYFKAPQQINEESQSKIVPMSIVINTQPILKSNDKNQLTKLNDQFESNMKKYRETKDIGYRKSCIGIANKIKQIKAVDETIRTVQKSLKKNATVSSNLIFNPIQTEELGNSEVSKHLKISYQRKHPKTVGQSLTSFVSEMDERSLKYLQNNDMYNYQYRAN